MTVKKNPAAVALGRRGGRKLAEKRGSDYFRALQAKRATFAGGRPPAPKTKRELELDKEEYERLYSQAREQTPNDTLRLNRLQDAINQLAVRIKNTK